MDERGLHVALFCAPVLAYKTVCSAPVLANHALRHTLIHFGNVGACRSPCRAGCENGWRACLLWRILSP